MAKTESTAVNELIDLVQSGRQPTAPEPAGDLFSSPRSTSASPRMTSAIPSMRGAGEVQPLPRGRAPHSTSQHVMPPPTPVRMSTADPSRGNTIPPLSRAPSQPGQPPATPRSSAAALPPPRNTPRATSSLPAQRASSSVPTQRPSLPPPVPTAPPPRPSTPPPHRASSPRASQQVPIVARATVPSMPSLPPPSAPVAAPFKAKADNPFAAIVPQQFPIIGRPQTVDATGDVVRADNWFDASSAVHKIDADGTAVVVRPRGEALSLAKKLLIPGIIAAFVGVMIGAFFVFTRDGGKPTKPVAAAAAPMPEQHVAMKAAPSAAAPSAVAPSTAPSTESANAATASAGAVQPEPPTKAEDVAKQEAAAAETARQAEAPKADSMLPSATTAALTHAPPAPATAKVEANAAKVEAPKAELAQAEPVAAVVPAPKPVAPAAKPEAAPAPVKAVATSSEPAPVREVQTSRGVVKLVDVRIDSKPSGATVMLVDNGKTSFLGSTPLATSLDPSRKYDVIFTLAGRPTQMAPLDPGKTSRLDVTLGRAHHSSSTKKEAPAATLGDSFIDKSIDAPKAAKTETPKADKAVAKTEAPAKADKKAAGEGTLMVSSKPPCEIQIDGKPTGLTTPQRSIPLAVGAHKITFINAAEGIKKTVAVSISADQSTKLIQDLMKK
ncbi:MAG TPA: hypothetical protein VIV40_10700 [Kofleriaceae bacterium]